MRKSRILDLLVSAEIRDENVAFAHYTNDSIESKSPKSLRGRHKTAIISQGPHSDHSAIERKSVSSRSPPSDSSSTIVTSTSQVGLRMLDLLSPVVSMQSQQQSVVKESALQIAAVSIKPGVPTSGSRKKAADLKQEIVQAKIPTSTIKLTPKFARNIDFLDLSPLEYSQKRASPPVARNFDNHSGGKTLFFPRLFVVPDPEYSTTPLTRSPKNSNTSSIYDFVKSPFESLAAELDILVVQDDIDFSAPCNADHSVLQAHLSRDLEQARAQITALECGHDLSMTRYKGHIEQMQGVISKLEMEKGDALHQSAAQIRLLSAAQNDLERSQVHIKSIESSQQDALLLSKLSRASMHQLQEEISRLEFDRQVMQEEIGRLKLEKNDTSANSISQHQVVARVREDLEQAQDQIRALSSSRVHSEIQFRATIEHMQEVISKLEAENSGALVHAVSQARLISRTQNDLEQAQAQNRSMESSQHDATSRFVATMQQLQEELSRSKLERQVLQEQISKLEAEQKSASLNAASQSRLIASFEQSCAHTRDVEGDQELLTNFRVSLQQMQEDISLLELEKRNALTLVTSQATLMATARNDLELARQRIAELEGMKQEVAESKAIIGLLQGKADKLAIEKRESAERASSQATLFANTRSDLDQARLRIAELEHHQRNSEADSNAIVELQKENISRLQLEKDVALADSERVRVESAAKELKSYASFYAMQRLSLQTQASKMEKCHAQRFSLHIDSKHSPIAQPLRNTRYRTQGLLSEVGIRSRRQCHALSIFFPLDSLSHRYFVLTYFMIAWAQFVTASKFHRHQTSIQVFRVKNRSTYFILKIRRKFVVAKFFTIWKANSDYTKC